MNCREHEFTDIALEVGPEGEPSGKLWRWCLRCGALELDGEVFHPGPHQKDVIVSGRPNEASFGEVKPDGG